MKVILFSMFCWVFVSAFAQKTRITGQVVNMNHFPIEYANVQLLNNDSVFVKGTVTDMEGNMEMETDEAGSFWIHISNVGYETYSKFIKNASGKLSLGNIVLKESAIDLDSVTITASRIVRQIDRQIVSPNLLEKKTSNSAFDLIGNMSLPRLKVDKIKKSFSLSDGGTVQVRINGVPSSVQEVYAIPSKDIIRVEYYDNPGAQVKEAAILDFIVRRRQNGGYASADLSNDLNTISGNDAIAIKLNHENSEFVLNYFTGFRSFKECWEESTTTFNYPDGHQIVREEKGIPSPFSYWFNYVYATYNYTLPDKRVFNIYLGGNFFRNNSKAKNLTGYSHLPNQEFLTIEKTKEPYSNPMVDVYYKEELNKKQILTLELKGGYNRVDYHRNYSEAPVGKEEGENYISNVDGDKYYFGIEGNYKKQWKPIVFLSGINYQWSHARNDYSGTIVEKSTLKNQDLYLYAQFQGEFKKLSYMGNIGVSYFDFNDLENTYRYWEFRPNMSLSYSPVDEFQIQYRFRLHTFAPSISEMSDVTQIIDPYQIKKGNPELKSCNLYRNQLLATYQGKRFGANISVYNNYIKNLSWDEIYYDESLDKFVSVCNNQKYSMGTGITMQINWQIIKDILTLSLDGEICWMKGKGTDFQHKMAPFFGGGQLNFSLKGWQASFEMHNRAKRLYGTSIIYDEWPSDILNFGYKYKDLYVGIQSYGLFSDKFSYGEENLIAIRPSRTWEYINSSPSISLRLSWNISWGKKSNSEEKEINHSNSDTGILKVK